MKSIKIIILFMLLCLQTYGQETNHEKASTVSFRLKEVHYLPDSNIEMTITLYGVKKKDSDYHAKCSAIRLLLFEGVGTGLFSKPFLEEGEHTAFESHPTYFQDLFDVAYNDFIKSCVMEGGYKKADKEKGTSFHLVVRALLLRRDLEKKQIRKKIGL